MSELNGKQLISERDELIDKLIQLRKESLTNGLTEDEIAKAFNLHRQWTTLFTSRAFQIRILVVVLAVVLSVSVGCYQLVEENVFGSQCLLERNSMFLSEVVRPLANCDICKDLTSVPVERDISTEMFVDKYAYTKIPVIIKGATTNWTAMGTFSFHFFKKLYTETNGSLESVDDFFPYKTEFQTLEDAFNMSDERARFDPGERPWYIGWSNGHETVENELRSHYEKPYFLPKESELISTDWIFMGGPGMGAFVHVDDVQRPSWQAQISGSKTWTLIPSPECESVCHEMKVTVQKGDIIVLDTNVWYHATFVHKGEISITIGSEYD